ncbi:DUF2326 domain-containing protein [Streptomyces sp. SID8385]|uniref:DUF2326 domain-containing protein n=1 Tax=Streptomyces sp. SID8385 TaxID=2690364 RepID=UPI0031BA64CD
MGAGLSGCHLIRDSHLYDGVDERQAARALALAAEVTKKEHMQYIVTLNTDTLSTAAQRGFNPEPHIRSPRLTDDEGAASSASASRPQAGHNHCRNARPATLLSLPSVAVPPTERSDDLTSLTTCSGAGQC